MKTMQTGKANYRLAARLRGNELLLDADLRKAVEEEHLRAVRRAEGLKCCADRRAFAESRGLACARLKGGLSGAEPCR